MSAAQSFFLAPRGLYTSALVANTTVSYNTAPMSNSSSVAAILAGLLCWAIFSHDGRIEPLLVRPCRY